MKIQRTGYTETDLIFCDYLKNIIGIEDEKVLKVEKRMINWLYSSSGWYDKTIRGSYFDIDHQQVVCDSNYHKFLSEYKTSISKSDHLIILIHRHHFYEHIAYLNSFIDSLESGYQKGYSGYWVHSDRIYDLLSNKKVLVINSFADLIREQYDNKNVYKIYPNFPLLDDLVCVNFPYGFFNNGPDNNGFETLDKIFETIKNINFDIALVGAGPYGAIIAHRISQMNRDAITMCSGITRMFGIDPKEKDKPFWISHIPEKYRPEGYEKIEKGRYWIGK